MAGEKNLFDVFKRVDKPLTTGYVPAGELLIQLLFDEEGAYLEGVDAKGRPVAFDYRSSHGALRDLLKAMDAIKEQQEAVIDWDTNSDHIYLHDHGHLLWLVRASGMLRDAGMQPLGFADGIAEIRLDYTRDAARPDDWLVGTLQLIHEDETLANATALRILNETHVLYGNTIHETKPLGDHARMLSLFNGALPEALLERSLSLLFSHFTGVTVRYGGLRTVFSEDVQAETSLIFEQVDETGALHLDVAFSLPRLPLDFVRDYDITRLATINEAEQTIVVRQVLYGSAAEERKWLNSAINRHRKGLEANDDALLFLDENGFVIGRELAARFLSQELGALTQRYTLFGAEKLNAYKVKAATPKLKLSLGYGIDFLEGEAQLDIDGESFSLFDVLAQHKKNRYVALSDGSRAVLDARYVAQLGRLFKKHEKGVKVSFFDLPMLEDLISANADRTPFARARDVFSGFNALATQPVLKAPIKGTLRPYQQDGLKWLDYLHTHKLGGCLADDMGLGKTIQTIALLARIYLGKAASGGDLPPSLLIMPRSLLFNWKRELDRFCPAMRYQIYHGSERDLDAALGSHLILTTYNMLRSNIKDFTEPAFLYVILDESQAIKNVETQTTKAVLTLKSTHRLAISGTPIENNLGELYSLFRFLNPAMFGSSGDFDRLYATPIHQHDDQDAARELRRKVYPFILRRLKRDVLRDLPDKVEQLLYVDMSDAQRKLYETRRAFYHQTLKHRIATDGIEKSHFFILEALMELRQVASIPEVKSEDTITSPKREMLIEQLQEAAVNGHKSLVFTNFLATIEMVSADLKERGIGHVTMTGATANREALVRQFQTHDETMVFLMTLKTGGVGLNLTAADRVFIFDPWWNVAAETQAVDRTHRIGQDKTVFTYKLIARDSIEEKIVMLQERKKALFDKVISSDGAAIKSLTEQDVDEILG